MGAVKLKAGSVSKVNKSDDALVCFCLVCVNLLSLLEEYICENNEEKEWELMLTYVNTIVRMSETLFVHMGDQNRPWVAIYNFFNSYIIINFIIIYFGICVVLNTLSS